jgi:hypothetical protein
MAKIPKSDKFFETQVEITSKRINLLTRTPRHTRGGIRCLGGVSIPFRLVTLAVSPVSWSWVRSYPLLKSVCQIQSYYWYEKCQTSYGSCTILFHLQNLYLFFTHYRWFSCDELSFFVNWEILIEIDQNNFEYPGT